MRIETEFPVRKMSGRAGKGSNLVFSTRYGNTHAWQMDMTPKAPTEAQEAVREKFKGVMELVLADMSDTAKRKEWEAKAAASGGEYVTARGVAFAHYWAAEEAA